MGEVVEDVKPSIPEDHARHQRRQKHCRESEELERADLAHNLPRLCAEAEDGSFQFLRFFKYGVHRFLFVLFVVRVERVERVDLFATIETTDGHGITLPCISVLSVVVIYNKILLHALHVLHGQKAHGQEVRLHPMRQIEMNTGVTFFMVFMFFMVKKRKINSLEANS